MFRVLCLADLHLGKPFVKPEKALEKAIDYALKESLDAVLIAGDLIDGEGDYFEAFALLEKEIKRLIEKKIRTVLVLGNHDYWLDDKIEGLFCPSQVTLLGKKGKWSSVFLEKEGKRLRIDGWSFPSRYHEISPFATFSAPFLEPDTVALGLIHGDYEVKSAYAPITKAQIDKTGYAAWILGHQHIPRQMQEGVYYPGSLQGLDITETGCHGALLLEIGSQGIEKQAWIYLAPLMFYRLQISLKEEGNWHKELYDEIEKIHESLHYDALEEVHIELVLRGKRFDYEQINLLEDKTILRQIKGVQYILYRKENHVMSPHNLEELAQSKSLLGTTAKFCLNFDDNLIDEAITYCQKELEKSSFREEENLFSYEEAKDLIKTTTMQMLDSLVKPS